jgi:predicted component of type VI protein secretion system
MQAVLVMFRNDGERRSFSISREVMVIGRRQDCDLMIPLGEISRKHCRIIRDEDSLRLEDLGSSNGTFHNGRRIQETTLEAGDTIQVGPVAFVIQIDGVPADDEIQPNLKAPAALGDDEDDLETLSDDLMPATDLDDDLDALDETSPKLGDSGELETVNLDDDDDESPKARRGSNVDDDDLELLAGDHGGGPGLDLDAEISENLALGDDDEDNDNDKLDSLTDSEAGEITLDDKSKRHQ